MSPRRGAADPPRLAALLVDDEPLATARLARLLEVHPEIEVVATAASAAEARQLLAAAAAAGTPGGIDVVFLDVEMPGGSGLNVLDAVSGETTVVFVTAYPQYAVDAFQVGAIDYLLKPVDPERLEQAVARVRKLLPLLRAEVAAGDDDDDGIDGDELGSRPAAVRVASPAPVSLAVPLAGGGVVHQVAVGDICWIEGRRNYSRVAIRDVNRVLLFRRRLAHWQAELPADTFARLSKSLLVNMAMLEKSQWRSRDETLLTFRGRHDSITIGRLPAGRLREILGARQADGSDPRTR